MAKKITPKKINIDDKISYRERHPEYGCAEFEFCPVFKNGKMQKLFIYRRQQESHEAFVIDVRKLKIEVFDITSWIHKTEAPRIWRNYWCSEHQCVAFDVYVPANTNQIVFNYHFGNTLSIRME